MNRSSAKNHFELLGLPERFALEPAALESAYRRVQGAVHPDRHAGASDAQRRIAMQLATDANEALRTLREPARRAGYLCALQGVDTAMQSNTAMPQSFLVSQLEWRERLEETVHGGALDGLEALRTDVGAERDALLARIGAAIDAEHDFSAAAALVRQVSFYDRLEGEIDAAEDGLLGH